MKDPIAEALQKIADGSRRVATVQLPPRPEQPPELPAEPTAVLPSALQAFLAIVIGEPEPPPLPEPVFANAAPLTSETSAAAADTESSSPPPARPENHAEVPRARAKLTEKLRGLTGATADNQTSAASASAGAAERVRLAAALALSVGMAWVVWNDLQGPPAVTLASQTEAIDVDQLLKEFETADHSPRSSDAEIHELLQQPAADLQSAENEVEAELQAPRLTADRNRNAAVQRTAGTVDSETAAPLFNETASEPVDDAATDATAAAVYPDQQPAQRPEKSRTSASGGNRPLRFTGRIQPMNRPATTDQDRF